MQRAASGVVTEPPGGAVADIWMSVVRGQLPHLVHAQRIEVEAEAAGGDQGLQAPGKTERALRTRGEHGDDRLVRQPPQGVAEGRE